jgi:hypothetical protein
VLGLVEVLPGDRVDFPAFAKPTRARPPADAAVLVVEKEAHALVERRLFAGTVTAG